MTPAETPDKYRLGETPALVELAVGFDELALLGLQLWVMRLKARRQRAEFLSSAPQRRAPKDRRCAHVPPPGQGR